MRAKILFIFGWVEIVEILLIIGSLDLSVAVGAAGLSLVVGLALDNFRRSYERVVMGGGEATES